jgi:hypothetical protein
MRNEKELSANLPTAKVVGIECRVVDGMGSKEKMCAIVEYSKTAFSFNGVHTIGKIKEAIPMAFLNEEPKGQKKKGWFQKSCYQIWPRLGGAMFTLSEIKKDWNNVPALLVETERLIEEMRTQKAQSGARALEDSIRRQARKLVEECEKLKIDPNVIMQEESDLYHVEKVMES